MILVLVIIIKKKTCERNKGKNEINDFLMNLKKIDETVYTLNLFTGVPFFFKLIRKRYFKHIENEIHNNKTINYMYWMLLEKKIK